MAGVNHSGDRAVRMSPLHREGFWPRCCPLPPPTWAAYGAQTAVRGRPWMKLPLLRKKWFATNNVVVFFFFLSSSLLFLLLFFKKQYGSLKVLVVMQKSQGNMDEHGWQHSRSPNPTPRGKRGRSCPCCLKVLYKSSHCCPCSNTAGAKRRRRRRRKETEALKALSQIARGRQRELQWRAAWGRAL